ncbi:hypothetical protein ACF0H5_021416 [Mactra antiquata]
MIGIFTIFLLAVSASVGHAAKGNHDGNVPDQSEVDNAIVNLHLHYNDKLCLELLLVDCSTHVTVGDEKICASNGVTYENHCRFTHAMCEYLHSQNSVDFVSTGECVLTTAAPTMAPGVVTTAMPSGSGTNAPIVSNAPGVTNAPMTTTTVVMVTTTEMPTTTNPINSIVQNVFCQNVATISCASGFHIICGTDGQLYPNECELSKAKCNNPSLTIADNSKCALP